MPKRANHHGTPGGAESQKLIMEKVVKGLKGRWDVEEDAARRFVRRHRDLPADDLMLFVEELEQHLARMHYAHFGYSPAPEVLRRAVVYGLDRLSSARGGLSEKQLAYFIQFAKDEVASERTRASDPGSTEKRYRALRPLKEVITCEEDDVMRGRLQFIYDLFAKEGLRLAKKSIVDACLKEKDLFPRRRAAEDTIETLRGAYEALGFMDGDLFITPDYLETERVHAC